jgi:hypothetical protein
MATPINARQSFPASPERVRAMLLDPEYAKVRAERTGALSVSAEERTEGDHGVLAIERVIPADVPDFARSFVGENLTLKEQHNWGPLADGSAQGTIGVTFSAPVGVKATMTLAPEGEGTVVEIDGSISASIPFMGGKVEEMVRSEMVRYLKKEPEIGAEWLASH